MERVKVMLITPNESLVSVIVPIYNAERYLKECIDSIISQTYKNLEVILINDGSEDNSGKIADQYAKKDDRIKVFHQKNAGVSAARNRALANVTGDWVMFMDADDLLPKNHVDILLNAAIGTRSQIVCGGIRVFSNYSKAGLDFIEVDNDGRKILAGADIINELLYQRGVINAPFAKLFKTEVIGKTRFFEDISVAEDLLFNYSVMENIDQAVVLDADVYCYRKHLESAINKPFSMKRMSGLVATGLIVKDAEKHGFALESAINRHFMEAVFIASMPGVKTKYAEAYRECADAISIYRGTVLKDSRSPIEYRLIAFISILSPNLAVWIYRLKASAGGYVKYGR